MVKICWKSGEQYEINLINVLNLFPMYKVLCYMHEIFGFEALFQNDTV